MDLKVGIFIEKYLTLSMTFIYRQIQNLDKKYDIIVFTSSKPENLDKYPIEKIYTKDKLFLEKIYYRFIHKIFRPTILSNVDRRLSFSQKRYFIRQISNSTPNLIHAHFGPGAIEIFPIVVKLKLPLLISFHGYDASMLVDSEIYIRNLQPIFDYARIIVPSNFMKNKLIEIGGKPDKIEVIYYGIPLEEFNFIERKTVNENRLKFLQVSNLVEKKGHSYSIKAFKRYVSKFPKATFTIAGDGPLRTKLEKLVKDEELGENVKFIGKVNPRDVKKLFDEHDVFIHHSVTATDGDQEGIPNVIMEAMASGLPVISSEHAGIPELIQDGVNGWLAPERNVEEIFERMLLIPKESNRISILGRKTIEDKFNLSKQIKKLEILYEDIGNNGQY